MDKGSAGDPKRPDSTGSGSGSAILVFMDYFTFDGCEKNAYILCRLLRTVGQQPPLHVQKVRALCTPSLRLKSFLFSENCAKFGFPSINPGIIWRKLNLDGIQRFYSLYIFQVFKHYPWLLT